MTTQRVPDQRHGVAAVLAWILGAASALLTAFFGYLVYVITEEWSGYVGGESQVALVILAFVGAVTLLLWLLAFVAFSKHRSRETAAKTLGLVV